MDKETKKIIDSFIDADAYRRISCAEVMECEMCEYCPLTNKCIWTAEIGEHSLTEKDYVKWLEYVDCISEMGADYVPTGWQRKRDLDEDCW